MPKRRPPAPPRPRAYMIGPQWRITMPDGEVLLTLRDVDQTEARDLARRLSVLLISYLSPVRDLTGDAKEIAAQVAIMDEANAEPHEINTASVFKGSGGTEVLVLEHHH